ncbi:OmpP1/FadL family transporter [Undibacterium terreum]|uniref:Outer membrane protein n=1 Tax=Undibacterium terreum TaxID=1224302 RepID=A0A916UJM4_9BURK|nr:OmpP1/FadL family transporter [Undibacterium terreum]GGC75399.1 putative outer membrane protein [Undibacterium terreum]
MGRKKNKIALHTLLAVAACGVDQAARASGYQFDVQSIRAQGSSNAGTAEASDPSTIFYNPAGLTRLESNQATFGGTAVNPHSTFRFSSATNGSGQPVSSADSGGNYAKQAVIPHGYLSHQINDRLTAGIGLFVPYGSKIGYDDNFAGRYYGSDVDFKSLNINPSLGFKLNARHSIGFGVSAQYLNVKLSKNQDLSPVAFGTCLAGGGDPATCQGAAMAYATQADAKVRVSGTDWGYGFNLGYLFTPSDGTRIGLAYRSFITQKLHGSAQFTIPSNLPGGSVSPLNGGIHTALANSDASMAVTTPESVSLNTYHELDTRWAVMGDITWNRHDRLQAIEIDMPTAQIPDRKVVQETAWRNSWRASVGASFKFDEQWTMRGGYMYDQSPASNSRYALTVLPDANRQMYSLGASYRIDSHNALDLAYSYIKLKQAPINRMDDDYDSRNGTPGVLNGSYHTRVNLIGIGYTHKF